VRARVPDISGSLQDFAAYAMPKDADILAFLLHLNQSCAAKEAVGGPITPPGLPLAAEEHGEFVTEDCIRVQS